MTEQELLRAASLQAKLRDLRTAIQALKNFPRVAMTKVTVQPYRESDEDDSATYGIPPTSSIYVSRGTALTWLQEEGDSYTRELAQLGVTVQL